MVDDVSNKRPNLILGAKTTNLISISPPNAIIGPVKLPEGVYGHCTVLVDEAIYLIGGYWMNSGTSNNVLSIEIGNGRMTTKTSSTFDRIHHGCAIFRHGNKTYIIVAGSHKGYARYYPFSKTSEIYDVQNDVWTEGPSLPSSCEFAKMITSPERDGAIFIGSGCRTISGDYHPNVIYRLNQQSNGTIEWITINQKFKYRRELPIIDYIDDSEANCYPKTTTTENPTIRTTPTTITTTTTLNQSRPGKQ